MQSLQTQSPKALLDHVRSQGMNRHHSPSFSVPLLTALAAKVSPSMIALVLMLAAAETLILMDPQRIPGWCALGAVIACVFVFVHEKHTSTNVSPLFLFLNALCTLFAGIAMPRPILTNWLKITNLETWYPETFVMIAALCGICGFTILHTLYLTITGELPAVVRELAIKGLNWLRAVLGLTPPPPPTPTPRSTKP